MLEGFLTLDLTSGPRQFAGRMLAQLGMRVVLAVGPGSPLPPGQSDAGWVFENAGKELLHCSGAPGLSEAISAADVVLLDPPATGLWELTADDIAASNPSAIVCVISAYGGAGPRARWAESELTVQAASGYAWANGDPDRAPVPVGGSQATHQGASQAVVGVLAALFDRERGGGGDVLDASQQEAMCNTITSSKVWWQLAAQNQMRNSFSIIGKGQRTRLVWPTKDGHISWRIGLGLDFSEPKMRAIVQWMVDDMGIGRDLLDVRWSGISTMEVEQAQLIEWESVFGQFFSAKTSAELFRGARERDILLVPVMTLEDLLADEHLASRDAFGNITYGDATYRIPRSPVRFDGRPSDAGGPPPPREAAPLAAKAPGVRPAPSAAGGARLPLEGLRILDFGWFFAGAATTRYLAMLGATVIKVESNQFLDTTRAGPPFVGKPSRDRSGAFAVHNNGKHSITVNLSNERSRPALERLVRWADVVAENFSAGRMEAWGLGMADLRRWNERIIMLRSSTWGQEGPYAAAPCNGVVLGGFSGLAHLTGWPDRPPLPPREPYTDMISPWFAGAALLAALIRRDRTGEGVEIDLSQLECVLNFIGPEFAELSAGMRVERSGPDTCDPYPSGMFRAAGEEEWCAISVETREQWRSLCRIVPDLADMAEASAAGIAAGRDGAVRAIAGFCARQSAYAIAHRLQAAGIAAAKVAKPEDVMNDAQLSFRQHFVETPHAKMGRFAYDMPAFRYRNRGLRAGSAPLIGEHNELVYGEWLGFSADEIADFYAAGVID